MGVRSFVVGLGLAAAAGWCSARRRRGAWPLVVALVVAAAASGALAAERERATGEADLPSGRLTVAGVAADDAVAYDGGERFTLRPSHLLVDGRWRPWPGPRLAVSGPAAGLAAGERVLVTGPVTAGSFATGSGVVAGRLAARRVERLGPATDPLFAAGNLLRQRVMEGVARFEDRPAAALLLGFLIGDESGLPDADREALRLSGLSHFVAVSGSNVAIFLAAWWLAAGPLAWGPRRRALLGLAGLAIFVVVTRWEPSVVRAATMAGLVLGGRLAGVALDGWTALGGAVTLLLLVSGDLAGDPGFQLSVAATAGVLAGSRLFAGRRPRWAWTALGATVSAQAAVAPLLLVLFGSVPLFAPLTNVAAAPLVALSTAVGGVGVATGATPLTGLALLAADAVLGIARFGRDLPQLGWAGTLVVAAAGALSTRPRLRPVVALAGVLAVGAATVLPAQLPARPEVVFLDVGQGDAILLRGPSGEVVLVDGGPDPALLRRALLGRGIRRIDLLVVTHGHADHVAGLAGIGQWASVGRLWHNGGEVEALASLVAEMQAAGVPVEVPGPGWEAQVGAFRIGVLGPLRRYASPNDGSLVLRVSAAGATVLLPGDIEAIAQADLGPLAADVLKVPHQGASTSDLEWLA
ncbi:MAG TPA: ComEC/Rec2 family competence protein, partial [Acidimicrobiia bacterium]|nr:ComEC/Rec2 family competence protein [Acidimicrobiia bacterium]